MLISEKLTAELEDVVVPGVTLKTLIGLPTLLGLAIVRAKSLSDDPEDLAAAAAGVLKESCARVDGERNGVTATLLGIAEGTRHLGGSERRRRAAALVPISEGRFRKKHEAEYLRAFSEDLVVTDSAFQARGLHEAQTPEPAESRLGVNWLEHHEAYRRIWSPVMALKLDLEVLLGYLRTNRAAGIELEQTTDQSPAPWPDIADRGMILMWRRAQFTTAIDRFVEDFGGLWLLSDPNQESRAAEAIYQLSFNGPCGSADDSWLRLRLAEAQAGELDDFVDVVYANDNGKDMLRSFLEWADRCRCSHDSAGAAPRQACEVHRWLAACDQYIELIDEDWDKVADWYRSERSNKSAP